MAPITSVKIELNNELRRFEWTPNWRMINVMAQVHAIFNVPEATPIHLSYRDEDGDNVRLSTDAELAFVLQLHAEGAISGSTLRLYASTGDEASKTSTKPVTRNGPQTMMGMRSTQVQFKCVGGRGKTRARFIKDVTVEDSQRVEAGARFTKTWRFRNDSELAWNRGTVLLFLPRNSDDLNSPAKVTIPHEGEVKPGQEVDISVDLTAPMQAGRYIAYYRLFDPVEAQRFGQRVWVQIQVPSASSDEPEEDDAVKGKGRKHRYCKKHAKLAAASSSSESEDDTKRDGKRKHKEHAEKKPWGELLRSMEQMGFDNKKHNVLMLRKHKGDIDAAVTELAEELSKQHDKTAQQ